MYDKFLSVLNSVNLTSLMSIFYDCMDCIIVANVSCPRCLHLFEIITDNSVTFQLDQGNIISRRFG